MKSIEQVQSRLNNEKLRLLELEERCPCGCQDEQYYLQKALVNLLKWVLEIDSLNVTKQHKGE